MGKKSTRGKPSGEEVPGPSGPEDLPERWSAQRKMELVLRLLRGEPLDAVSRESQVPAHELERWKRVFLDAGGRGLKNRSDPEERELTLAPGQSRRADDAPRTGRVPDRKKGAHGDAGDLASEASNAGHPQRAALCRCDPLIDTVVGLPSAVTPIA